MLFRELGREEVYRIWTIDRRELVEAIYHLEYGCLVLRPELWVQRVSPEDVVREVVDSVPTPKADDLDAAARQ